jgi:hypothetical protein
VRDEIGEIGGAARAELFGARVGARRRRLDPAASRAVGRRGAGGGETIRP